MNLPPLVLLSVGKPVWIVVLYAIVGALFMRFLAGETSLHEQHVRLGCAFKTRRYERLIGTALLPFGYLCVVELSELAVL